MSNQQNKTVDAKSRNELPLTVSGLSEGSGEELSRVGGVESTATTSQKVICTSRKPPG